jgi:hypothetical protein
MGWVRDYIPPTLTLLSKLSGDPDRRVRDGWGTRSLLHWQGERFARSANTPPYRDKTAKGWGTRRG